MEGREIVKLAVSALEDKKGKDIRVLDLRDVTVIADYFVICSGDNLRQVDALYQNVDEVLGRAGVLPKSVEGKQGKSWILLDYGDVIIHLFDAENRLFYNLERIWRDGKTVDPAEI